MKLLLFVLLPLALADQRENPVPGLFSPAHVDPKAHNIRPGSPPFDSRWYRGGKKYQFKQNGSNVAWSPKHPQVVLTHFPEERISKVGDYVAKKFYWMSKGKNECDEEYYANGDYCKMQKCAHSSVNCLAGTGDFRIGLYDSKTDGSWQIKEDGFANATKYSAMCRQLEAPPFREYRGYNYRIYPHLSSKATSYVHPKTGSHVPCGFYFKGGNEDSIFAKYRLNRRGNGCFELPLGAWSVLTLSLKRTSSHSMELVMDMNGFSYTVQHNWEGLSKQAAPIPKVIDTVVIMYPNGRRYYDVEWADVPPAPFMDLLPLVVHEHEGYSVGTYSFSEVAIPSVIVLGVLGAVVAAIFWFLPSFSTSSSSRSLHDVDEVSRNGASVSRSTSGAGLSSSNSQDIRTDFTTLAKSRVKYPSKALMELKRLASKGKDSSSEG
mmetsp:Transcript_19480/g.32750  ORF Transcript_19480/g.32750 Transcript_19480/m.32750 type:complete len:434 (-) Transcript_19480:164-1465(-)